MLSKLKKLKKKNTFSRSEIQKDKVKVRNLSLFKWAQLSTMKAAILKATQ